jgi:6-pyruvoyltetrahydropterin/6-carboxytetrahydropterin synthase
VFEVGIVVEFDASHLLRGDFGPASQRHEHRYRVEVAARGERLQPDGTLFDITRLQDALRAALSVLDQRHLNDLTAFRELNPTAEVVAQHLFQQIAPTLAATGVGRLAVRVWESPEAYAAYEGAPV